MFLVSLRQPPRVGLYEEKIPPTTLSGGIGRKSLPLEELRREKIPVKPLLGSSSTGKELYPA
jgi:hypothetical protein